MDNEELKARIAGVIDNWTSGTATNDVFGIDEAAQAIIDEFSLTVERRGFRIGETNQSLIDKRVVGRWERQA